MDDPVVLPASRWWKWLVLAIALVAVAGLSVLGWTSLQVKFAADANEAMFATLRSGDVGHAYLRTPDWYRSEHTPDQFANAVRSLIGAPVVFTDWRVVNDHAEVGGAVGTARGPVELTTELYKCDDGEWRVYQIAIAGREQL